MIGVIKSYLIIDIAYEMYSINKTYYLLQAFHEVA